MNNKTRRDFFKIAGAGIAGSALLSLNAPLLAKSKNIPFQIGMASYTFRKFNLEDTLAMTKRLGIKEIAFKSVHLPLDSSENKIMSVISRVKTAGLDLYGGGVIYMKNENDVNQAFDYATCCRWWRRRLRNTISQLLSTTMGRKIKDTPRRAASMKK